LPHSPQRVGIAGALVQVVDVLADDGQHTGPARGIGSKRPVAGVGLRSAHTFAPLGIPVPDALRVGAKALFAGQLSRVEARPQAGQCVAEGRDATFGAHAGAGQHAD
jgi:hypothetical protein